MTPLIAGIAVLIVAAVALVAFLRRNDQRIERDDPTVNQSGGPGFDDDDDKKDVVRSRPVNVMQAPSMTKR